MVNILFVASSFSAAKRDLGVNETHQRDFFFETSLGFRPAAPFRRQPPLPAMRTARSELASYSLTERARSPFHAETHRYVPAPTRIASMGAVLPSEFGGFPVKARNRRLEYAVANSLMSLAAISRPVRLNSWGPNVYPPVNIRNLSTGESGEKRAAKAKVVPN